MRAPKRKIIIRERNGRRRVATTAEAAALRRMEDLRANMAAQRVRLQREASASTQRAREDAVKWVLEQRHLPVMLQAMAAELGRALGTSELRDVAQRVLASSRRPLPEGPLRLYVQYECEPMVFRIEGEIPSIHYCVRVLE